jgi:hypothetical protein
MDSGRLKYPLAATVGKLAATVRKLAATVKNKPLIYAHVVRIVTYMGAALGGAE